MNRLKNIRVQLDIHVGADIRKHMSENITVNNQERYFKWAVTNHSLAHILTARNTSDVCEYLLDAIFDYKRGAGSDLKTIKRMKDIILSNLERDEADVLEEEFKKIEKDNY